MNKLFALVLSGVVTGGLYAMLSSGLVLTYRSIPAQVKERLGRGNAAVAFMRLGNAEDAKVAAEQIGTEHRFVLSQLTDTVGANFVDTDPRQRNTPRLKDATDYQLATTIRSYLQTLAGRSSGLKVAIGKDAFDALTGGGSFDCVFPDGPAISTVKVTVSDSDGASDSNAIDVTVDNVKPSIVLSGSATADEGDTKTYTFAVSDPGQDDHTVTTERGGEVRALDDVDVEFQRGVYTAIMGPSGSGKSTLLHCIAGLDTLTSGQVFLGDTELSALNEKHLTQIRRDKIGFVFQSYNLIPTLTAIENITLPGSLAGRETDPQWLEHVIDIVGLRDRLKHRPRLALLIDGIGATLSAFLSTWSCPRSSRTSRRRGACSSSWLSSPWCTPLARSAPIVCGAPNGGCRCALSVGSTWPTAA